jgi:hypothetical protein
MFWMVVCRRRGGLRDPDLVTEVQMANRKMLPYLPVMSFVLGVVIFVMVALLVRVHVPQAFALSLGGFAMLIVGLRAMFPTINSALRSGPYSVGWEQ